MNPSKRAVVVGVGKPLSGLTAPEAEAKAWSTLLEIEYDFTVTRQIGPDATYPRIESALKAALANSAPTDEVVFIFCGAGTVVDNSRALILYPDPQYSALMKDIEFGEIVKASGFPSDGRLTLVIDACFSGGFSVEHGIVQFVDIKDLLALDGVNIEISSDRAAVPTGRFELFGQPEDSQLQPLYIAAAGPRDAAIELPRTPRRLRFSKFALEELKDKNRITYRELIDAVYRRAGDQHPGLHGNPDREGDVVFGGPRPLAPVVAPKPAVPSTPSATSSTMSIRKTLSIRVLGTCAFIDNSPSYSKRLVMPHDDMVDGAERHIPFLEVRKADIVSTNAMPFGPYNHKERLFQPQKDCGTAVDTGDVQYVRFQFAGAALNIEDADHNAPPLFVSNAFANHVPSVLAVNIGVPLELRPEVLDPAPPADLIAAYFDIDCGYLDVGTLYDFNTKFFAPDRDDPTKYQTPRYVQLLLPLIESFGKNLIITWLQDGVSYSLELQPSTDYITVGNATEADILGLSSGDDIEHHYKLYYKLARPPLPWNLALPANNSDPSNSCTVTTWP